MGLPSQPVTLTVEQVSELNRKLSAMRHDINNNLSLVMAAMSMAILPVILLFLLAQRLVIEGVAMSGIKN